MSTEQPGNQDYQQGHMGLIFEDGFSFSGYERDGFFLNQEGEKFKEISGVSGIDSILDGRAVVLADFDNDGDEDVFVTTIQDEAHLLFRNNVGQDKKHLRIQLVGSESGRDAFGSVLRLKTPRGIQTRIKSGGNGFLSHSDTRVLFGLGDDPQIDWLEVTWSSGKKQRFDSLPRGSSILIREGSDEVDLVEEQSFSLPKPLSPAEAIWEKLEISRTDTLPALNLTPLESAPLPASLEKGKAYLINLWATWCSPCRKEMPELEKLLPRFEAARVELIGVSVDQGISPAEIIETARRIGATYPLYQLAQDDWSKIFPGGNLFVPLSIFVDEKGKVIEAFAGWNSRTEEGIRELLRRRGDSRP